MENGILILNWNLINSADKLSPTAESYNTIVVGIVCLVAKDPPLLVGFWGPCCGYVDGSSVVLMVLGVERSTK